MTRISEMVRNLRKSKGLTMDDLAEQAGVCRSTIIRYEDPKYTNHNVKTLRKICQILGVNPEVIFRSN